MANKKTKKKRKQAYEPKGVKLLYMLWNDKVTIPDEDGSGRIVKDFTSLLFSIIAWIMLIGSVAFLAASIYAAIAVMKWQAEQIIGNIVGLFLVATLCTLCFVIAVIIKVMANDIKREKDRHYVLAAFSGIISFVALIVSLISLF